MTEATFTPGGAFLIEDAAPEHVFIPEEFGAEARLMADTAAEFLKREVLPQVERIEAHDPELLRGLMRQAGDLGLLGAELPEALGGLGVDCRTGALLAEKLNWQQSFALMHEAHTVLVMLPLLWFGTPEQQRRFLPLLASGEWIGAFCLSEPGTGSDALGAQTRAVLAPDGAGYVLNGTKMWITNAGIAALFLVFAKVGGERFTAFLVERDFSGVSFGREESKLGMRGTSTRRVILDSVPVPAGNVLGEVGQGHRVAFGALNMGRFKLEAGAVGGLKETLALCAAYAKQRKQFGRPLAVYGLIQAKLGEMAARTFALESAVYRLAGLLDTDFAAHRPGEAHPSAEYAVECAVVKVVGSELYSWATDEGIQLHGGNGYTEEFPMARAWRDQRLLRIGEGANEVVRLMLVREMLRRSAQGRLALEDAMAAARALRAASPPPRREEAGLPGCLKTGGLLLLALAREAYGDGLMEEQEVVAAVADILASAYIAESAWARAEKLRARGEGGTDLARDAARLVTEAALHDAAQGADAVLSRLPASGVTMEDHALALRCLLAAQGNLDVIGLRRRLAAAVLEREGYPWSTG